MAKKFLTSYPFFGVGEPAGKRGGPFTVPFHGFGSRRFLGALAELFLGVRSGFVGCVGVIFRGIRAGFLEGHSTGLSAPGVAQMFQRLY